MFEALLIYFCLLFIELKNDLQLKTLFTQKKNKFVDRFNLSYLTCVSNKK